MDFSTLIQGTRKYFQGHPFGKPVSEHNHTCSPHLFGKYLLKYTSLLN